MSKVTKSEIIPQLQNRGLFLIYCQVEPTGLRVGIPVWNCDQVAVGDVVRVIEPDGDRSFFVEVPALGDDDYDVLFRFPPAALCLQAQNVLIPSQN